MLSLRTKTIYVFEVAMKTALNHESHLLIVTQLFLNVTHETCLKRNEEESNEVE